MTKKKIKVLIAHPGLDSHWIGGICVAKSLMHAGMEVIYLGNSFPESIVKAAMDEGVDVLGLSILSGAHLTLIPQICQFLREKQVSDMLVIVGGTIPREDAEVLKSVGVAEVFGPGTMVRDIVQYIEQNVEIADTHKAG